MASTAGSSSSGCGASMPTRRSTERMRAGLLAIASLFALHPAWAQSPVEICLSVDQALSGSASLPRTAAAFKAGGPLRIVAIGSSSTVGLWQTDPALTYPGQLKAELARQR